MKEIIKYGLILGLICFLSSAILAVVNGITEPKIKAQEQYEETQALSEVMPQSISFKPSYEMDKILYYKGYDSQQQLNGFVVKAETKGYSSLIQTLVGLNLKLEIVDIKILSENETPGLGNRILEPAFLSQFKGKGADRFHQLSAITGATISSQAVIRSVREKIAQLKDMLLAEVKP